eukprot:5268626-Amphidinium_carterae.1
MPPIERLSTTQRYQRGAYEPGRDRHLDYPFMHAVAPPSPVFVRYMLRRDFQMAQSQPNLPNTSGTASTEEQGLDDP